MRRYLAPLVIALLAVAALVFMVVNATGGIPVQRPDKPHVVFIVADDMGFADVGYRNTDIHTPNIDEIASQGVDVASMYAQPVCSQTRAAVLTGRYPFRYGLQHGVIRMTNTYGLPLSETLLPEQLQQAGYKTALIGKWHLGHYEPDYLPMARGFDHHYGPYGAGVHYFTHQFQSVHDWHRAGEPVFEEGYVTHLLTAEAVGLIDNHDPAQPLFLMMAYTAPHSPARVPPSVLKDHLDDNDQARATFRATVGEMDKGIGEIRAALERKGMSENTLMIFISDNGGDESDGASNGQLRGGKGKYSYFEAGLRIPALFSMPGKIPAGTALQEPAHVVDIYATIAELAGIDPKLPADGVNLWPHLTGTSELDSERVLPLVLAPERRVLRAGDWRIISGPAKSLEAALASASGSASRAGGSGKSGKGGKSGSSSGSSGKSSKGGKSGSSSGSSGKSGKGGKSGSSSGSSGKSGKGGKSGESETSGDYFTDGDNLYLLFNLEIDPAEKIDLAKNQVERLVEMRGIIDNYMAQAVEPLADPDQNPAEEPGGDDFVYPPAVGVFDGVRE